jgi:uncharacterized protein YbbC (DUF1343 family)
MKKSAKTENTPLFSFETVYPLKKLKTGAERTNLYLEDLKGKKVGLVTNQTGIIGKRHLVDTLIALQIDILRIFAPEHGFRGKNDAGEHVASDVDAKTGIPIISLYGNSHKPSASALEGIEIMVFDIQDVGARFYTYLSTMHYVMEACAESGVPILVMDRPNPNGHYVDGPVLDLNYKSFVGMHPVPIVYGMTIGEYAQMINGEGWLKDSIQADLRVVPLQGYSHKTPYNLTVAPSPNLKSAMAISLYPSLCLFEATVISVGRGTERPFEMFGHPKFEDQPYRFTPAPSVGASSPKWEFITCMGVDLHKKEYARMYKINLSFILEAFESYGSVEQFFESPNFFNKLAGNGVLIDQIKTGVSEDEIRASWKPALQDFKDIRKKYLIYN